MNASKPIALKPGSISILDALALGRFVSTLRRELKLRRDLEHLAGLTDAQLKDLGLARGNLEAAVRAGGDPRR